MLLKGPVPFERYLPPKLPPVKGTLTRPRLLWLSRLYPIILAVLLLNNAPLHGANLTPGNNYQLWQTNADGNDIHIYDTHNQSLIQRIEVGPQPHGIAYAPLAQQIFVTLEKKHHAFGELLWLDPLSREVTHRIKVGRRPQALGVTPDGKWIYVPCRDGHYWVIDGRQKKVAKKIYTGGMPHNTIISKGGHYAYLSPMGTPHHVSIIDINANHRLIGTLPFHQSLRPSALSNDGKYFFHHVDKLNGFEVADVKNQTFMQEVHHKSSLGLFTGIGPIGWLSRFGFQTCHGLAIRPNQNELWSTCGRHLNIHSLTPPFKQTHTVRLSGTGYWLAFTPDSRHAFIALKDKNRVAVIDATLKTVIHHYDAGEKPKRNVVIPAVQPHQ